MVSKRRILRNTRRTRSVIFSRVAVIILLSASQGALGQKLSKSPLYGGSKGAEFSDKFSKTTKISKILVRHGDFIDAIQLTWAKESGGSLTGKLHGGSGGSATNIELADDEYILRIEGYASYYVTQLTFFTNQGNIYGPFGGGGGSPFVLSDAVLFGFYGRYGLYLDAIGFYTKDLSSIVPKHIKSELRGGVGGKPFSDTFEEGSRLAELIIRNGLVVDAIQATWITPSGKKRVGKRHGGSGGERDEIVFARDEFITHIEGVVYDGGAGQSWVSQLLFVTNLGRRYGPYGKGGGKSFSIDNVKVIGFFGQSHEYVNSIGVLSPNPKWTLQDDIVAYYPLDADADDATGNDRDAFSSDSLDFVDGLFGRAAQLSNSEDFMILPALDKGVDQSVTAWVYLDSRLDNSESTLVPIIEPFYISRPENRLVIHTMYETTPSGDTVLLFEKKSKATLSTDTWHHVAFILDAYHPRIRFVVDGKSETINAVDPKMYLDSTFEKVSGAGLGGRLDDLTLHNRALNPAEVAFLAQGGGRNEARGATAKRETSCGTNGQVACKKCSSHWWWPPMVWGTCQTWDESCEPGEFLDSIHGRCYEIPKPPEFSVKALPEPIDIPGYQRLLKGIKGHYAIISNAQSASYFVPDGRIVEVDCDRLQNYANYACNNGLQKCDEIRKRALDCEKRPTYCNELSITDHRGNSLEFPFYTLEEWHFLYPSTLKINANWFDIDGPPAFQYTLPCTDIYGYSNRAKNVVSKASNPDRVGNETNLLDAFVVIDKGSHRHMQRSLKILSNSDIAGQNDIYYGVGGFILAKDGNVERRFPSSIKPAASGARTALGLSKDGTTLYIVVVQAGPGMTGMKPKELALYMTKVLGAYDVINLDNSGSSQFLYDDGQNIVKSVPGDWNPQSTEVYRPIPNFLSISK